MSKRQVQLVLLCEDRQHEAFLRRFFEVEGWHPRSFRVERCSKPGSGEQWVRVHYPDELRKLRAAHVSKGLVVCIDEDKKGAGHREAQLADALKELEMRPVGTDEKVLHVVPARNIETWIAYLDGKNVDELTPYPKLQFQRECARTSRDAFTMFRVGGFSAPGTSRHPP